jgi:hypothetical protein
VARLLSMACACTRRGGGASQEGATRSVATDWFTMPACRVARGGNHERRSRSEQREWITMPGRVELHAVATTSNAREASNASGSRCPIASSCTRRQLRAMLAKRAMRVVHDAGLRRVARGRGERLASGRGYGTAWPSFWTACRRCASTSSRDPEDVQNPFGIHTAGVQKLYAVSYRDARGLNAKQTLFLKRGRFFRDYGGRRCWATTSISSE